MEPATPTESVPNNNIGGNPVTDPRPPRHPDRLRHTLERLARRVHRLDRGSRLQLALVVEDCLDRTLDAEAVPR